MIPPMFAFGDEVHLDSSQNRFRLMTSTKTINGKISRLTETVKAILLVGIGGAVGAILRYLICILLQNGREGFPYGTLAVNVLGSFLLSLVMFLAEYQNIISENTRNFLAVGLLGAFTTLSTFSFETFKFIENNELLLLTLYVSGTIILSILAIILGRELVITIMNANSAGLE